MSKQAVLIAVLLSQVFFVNAIFGQGMDLLDQQNNEAVEHDFQQTASDNGPAARYTFQREIQCLNPTAASGTAFDPAFDGIEVPNSQVKVPAACLPGIGEGDMCEGDYVSTAGACYGMVVVAANYYRRVVRRVGAGRPAVTWWDARNDVCKVAAENRSRMLPLFNQQEDPSASDGVNNICKKAMETHNNTKDVYSGDKSRVYSIRLSNLCFHETIKETIRGAALWHQIDQHVPGCQKRVIEPRGEALHNKMVALRGRLDRHGLATIVWRHNGNSTFGHAFLLYAIHEVEVKRGGGSTEPAWELRIYDPNKTYKSGRRSTSCIYYLPNRQRMTFSPELIKCYSQNGHVVQENAEFIDGNVESLAEIIPEVWNTTFLARTIVYKKERKYLREAATTRAD